MPPRPVKNPQSASDAPPTTETEQESAAEEVERLIRLRQRGAHKERRSRDAYAFGVDIRRNRWFVQHRLIGAGLRTVERRWHARWQRLEHECLDPGARPPTAVLTELATCVATLGAPVPTVRCLGESARLSGRWPTITPLGTSHGGVRELLVDLPGLESLTEAERRFLMGAALGHLQCDHAIMFTAHLMAGDDDAPAWSRALRAALAPTTRLMCFSADRAGMLCSGNLEAAMEGMRHHVAESRSAGTAWLPQPSSYDLRVTALREFHRSDVLARVKGASAARGNRRGDAASDHERPQIPHVPDDAWSVARVDERLTRRLGLF